KEEEFKEIFLAEALDQYEELNRLFTILEKNHHDKPTVEAIFRTTHTLKANAASMGFEAIANMAHVLEDIFSEIKNERMMLTPHVFAELFRANDKLGELIHSIKTGESISYKGLMAKLKVILQRGKEAAEKQKNNHHPPIAETPSTPEVEPSSLKSPFQQEMAEAEKKEEMPLPPTDYTSSSLVETKSDSEDLAPPVQNQPIETDFGSLLEENVASSVAESENQKETESPLEIAPKEVIHEDVKVELSESTISAKSEPSVSTEKNERVQQAQEEKEKEEIKTPQITFSDLVQVPVKKLDNLLNLVGELAIEKDRLMASNRNVSELASLHRITSDLQYSVMGVRLVQVSVLFQKFHRIVRDVALYENKKVNLVLEGTEVEIDRNILQIISDSMIHLVRNAISH
ncbi:MAG: Hpt domain-containing protein, partial [Flammeovirgaceae bacterium]|nr:Hpt domain-containing protein [Flammeovirgaceae bacterium]MDW8288812.1 Hpt domain-containing protein [Flammeovirgaceae bacterium]